MSRRRIFAPLPALGAVTLAASLAACGGGGGGGGSSPAAPPPTVVPTVPPTATPTVTPLAVSIANLTAGAQPVVASLPAIGSGVAASFGIGATNFGSTSVGVSLGASSGSLPVLSATRRALDGTTQGSTPLAYLLVASSSGVTFAATPSFTFVLPSTAIAGASYAVAFYDAGSALGWQKSFAGPVQAVDGSVTFPAVRRSFALAAGTSGFALFVTAGATPAPTATPVPTATPAAAPATPPSPRTSTSPTGSIVPPALTSPGGAGGTTDATGTVRSIYTMTSSTSGLPIYADGARIGSAPATFTPPDDGNIHTVAFGSAAGLYTVSIRQSFDGPHTLFYNAAGDSSGSLALGSLQTARRASSTDAAVARGRTAFHASDVVTTQVAVRYRAGALRMAGRRPADIERVEGAAGLDSPTAGSDPLRVVFVPHGTDNASFARRLSAHAEVAEVTPVHKRRKLSRAAQTVPNAYFTNYNEWYLFATGANYAWAYGTGSGAKIAVIDTGVDNNIANLASQIVYQERIVSPADFNGNPTGAPVISSNAQDYNGHGTNVAGLALGGSNSAGFAGVAYNAQLLAFDIFPDTTASSDAQATTTTDEARAISDAIAYGADVISMSIGSPSYDSIEHDAVEVAILAGVTVVAAAGNSDQGEVAGTIDYPANYSGVIAVGASTAVDGSSQTYASITGEKVASYSQYGPNLAVVAPGGDAKSSSDPDLLHWILGYSTTTTNYASDRCTRPSPATSCTTKFNGTSQATPQVAGTAALLISLAGGHGKLTPAQVAYLIDSTADNINDAKQGHGRLNAYRAVASLIGDTAAYSGPVAAKTAPSQAVAFAYATGGTNQPAIIDTNYPGGVPIASNGTFRIADVPANASYRVAVWYDANGDGIIDAGDQIGVSMASCSGGSPCAIGTIALAPVTSGYRLP